MRANLMIKNLVFNFEGRELLIRETREEDLASVTSIINSAYKMWNSIGFDKANQTIDKVKTFALRDGHVVSDSSGNVMAAFNICCIEPQYENGILSVNLVHRIDKTVLDEKILSFEKIKKLKLIYFYGLCVHPEYTQSGLGKKLFEIRERFAQENGFQGILFETGRDARWLVEWYQRLGFTIIGNSNADICSLPLVMMFKKI